MGKKVPVLAYFIVPAALLVVGGLIVEPNVSLNLQSVRPEQQRGVADALETYRKNRDCATST